MPFGIRPSNVRVCHSTTRALCASVKLSADGNGLQVALLLVLIMAFQPKTQAEHEIPMIRD
jgi:hypothetical protein